ncbi:NADH-quinone oxidoreductase subunit L [Candidatus Protochlamydia phocaeensis]|uniref:NADH-quinone oxidoreductase subunit L n=1 Tax=Candidatus Protochlamydia phocaeensis TaxID=1414722 RepID=UPI0008392E7C|nr:NADH-quinone oxidoreductase subunit L [Candidatus Protochlamydia phocaeensis]
MLLALCLGLFLPLASFLALAVASNKISRRLAGIIASSVVFISFVCFSGLLYVYVYDGMPPTSYVLYNWIPVKGIDADFSLRLDPLSLTMTLIITGVGFLIHVYSIGYMDHDEDFARYFAFMNFFVFSMLLLVLAANVLLLFVGWEGVGLASYLLIGFWYDRPAAAQAATKAFVVNRIGDLGLLIGLLLTFHLFGTSDIAEISKRAGPEIALGAPILTLLTFLYFWGATGKSAQLPLYTWLPDAMEGPTPVSALIHAATMVTAGVYLVVRMHPVFELTPETLGWIGDIGAATSLFAALCALAQNDLKRVLAYSTISQLGLMFLACGVGAFYAAMFHLTTHAFVKALLFLSAGNVIHMMHGTTDMNQMGGLAKKFPKTHWFFLIGVLALSGIPPLSGFFSKELILEQEHIAGFDMLFYVGLAASILTAFYLTRAYCLTFTGKPLLEQKVFDAIKEAPPVMTIPVAILAFLSVIGGVFGFAFNGIPPLESFLEEVGVTLLGNEPMHQLFFMWETWLAIIGALLGVGTAAWMYTRYVNQLGSPIAFLKNSFYVNEIYEALIEKPLEALSRFIANQFEPKVFDGMIQGVVVSSQGTARWLQRLQSGQIRSYIALMVVGMALLIFYFAF